MDEQLLQRIRTCPNLPSLPAIAVQVLNLAQKADVDIAEIARIISKDPALSGKILRTVNSSFYGRSQHVSTISHALVILGLQSVKTLVLGFSLVSNLAQSSAKGFKHITFWKHSIYAATAARQVAAKIGLIQQEEAFLVALLADIGMLVLDLVVGEAYGEVHEKSKSHDDVFALEQGLLGATHAEVSGMLAEQWKLPPLLTVPIANHHTPERVADPTLRKLTEVVWLAGRCADVFVDAEPALAIAAVRGEFQLRHGIAGADCDAIMNEISARTKEVASLFEINIGSSSANYDAILKKANDALIEITLQSQREATTLQQQNVELKQRALTDGLTGLANRTRFDEFLAETFSDAVEKRAPMALLMLDVDKFKTINDTHGHPGGDQVLRILSRLVKAIAGPTDLAARYGGEEMALVLPGANRAAASMTAEKLRRAIAARPVTHGAKEIPVTASIGVSCFEPDGGLKHPAHLIKAADLALYNAKHSGRNCVKVFSLKPGAPGATTGAGLGSMPGSAPGASNAIATEPATQSVPVTTAHPTTTPHVATGA